MKQLTLQDLKKKPRYLVTFTVGFEQRNHINSVVKKVFRDIRMFFRQYLCVFARLRVWFLLLGISSVF